jgi:hypothetical protein
MQLHKFFDLKTPEDLLHKLERDYERWKADPLNVDLAWNFFVTAEHLPDWIYYQDMPTSGTERPDLLDGHTPHDFKLDLARPELRVCCHLANGAKHFHLYDPALNDPKLSPVGDTVHGMTSFVEPGFVEPGFFGEEPVLWVYLSPHEQAALGRDKPNVYALWLATRVLELWRFRRLT